MSDTFGGFKTGSHVGVFLMWKGTTSGYGWLEDCLAVSWNLQKTKSPVWGYNSYLWDAVAQGTIVVVGQFVIAFRDPHVLYQTLAIEAGAGTSYDELSVIDTSAAATENRIAELKQHFWGTEKIPLSGERRWFSAMPVHHDRHDGRMALAMMVLFGDWEDGELVYSTGYILDDLEITGVANAAAQTDSPLTQAFSFIAREQKLAGDEVTGIMDLRQLRKRLETSSPTRQDQPSAGASGGSNLAEKAPAPGSVPSGASEYTVLSVEDGDTLTLRIDEKVQRVRVWGIDAPETEHPNSPAQPYSSQAMTKLLELCPVGSQVRLVNDPREAEPTYERIVLQIVTKDGADIAATMISGGFAWYANYGSCRDENLARLQAAAVAAKSGLWGLPGAPEPPSNWRANHKKR